MPSSRGHLLGDLAIARAIGFATCRGSAGPSESSFGPDQRIRALQVDVIGDQHQAAALELEVDAAGGVGEHHASARRASPARARRRSPAPACSLRRGARGRPSRPRRASPSLPMTSLPAWPTAVDSRPAGNLGVGNLDALGQLVGERAQPAAQHHADARAAASVCAFDDTVCASSITAAFPRCRPT